MSKLRQNPESRKVRKTESVKVRKKSEVGMSNAEVKKKLEVGSPKSEVKKKSEVGMSNAELENPSAPDSYRDDISQSELNKQSKIVNRKSEIETLPTANSKLQTETMEVHHHPEVEKKGFKEYILEGLMIFLAVTMGFFAESLREHIGDNSKEMEYIHSFVEDLKQDTAALNYSIKRLNRDVKNCDELIRLYAADKLTQQPDTIILDMSNQCGLSVDVFFNDRTASQLKGTGSMRLIRNKMVADSMLQYWNTQFRLDQVHNRFESMRVEQRKVGWKTFNWYITNYNFKIDHHEMIQIKKAIVDVRNLNEFVNVCSTLYNAGKFQYLPLLNRQLALAATMIKMVKKQYHLQDE